jgi:xanthine dehydrogenase small subunit
MQQAISFVLNGKIQIIHFNESLKPTTTVLNYLRSNPNHKGVKEGCAEGDCGACTVVIGELKNNNMIEYKAWDSCLVFLPMLHGKQLITVENLSYFEGAQKVLHPVQKTMVECNGSQCGYCTPGIIMSLFSLYKNEENPTKEIIEDALTGNLCRCTGYKPIIEAAIQACSQNSEDQFSANEKKIIDLLVQIKEQSHSVVINSKKQIYYQPKTIQEALELKNKIQNAILINGATDIALRVTKRHELLETIIDLSAVEEIKNYSKTISEIRFGAGMNLEEIKKIAKTQLPALYDTLAVFGSKQIRSLATLGGNIGSASPIGDTLPILMAYNAEVILQSVNGERKFNINNFILDYRKTERQANEIITTVIIPWPSPKLNTRFYKISKRKDLDISTESAGFSIVLNNNTVEQITLAYGGMAAITKRAGKAENYLKNKTWERNHIEHAMDLIAEEFTPISDARSGAEFRKIASKNLLLKFWSETNTAVGN